MLGFHLLGDENKARSRFLFFEEFIVKFPPSRLQESSWKQASVLKYFILGFHLLGDENRARSRFLSLEEFVVRFLSTWR